MVKEEGETQGHHGEEGKPRDAMVKRRRGPGMPWIAVEP